MNQAQLLEVVIAGKPAMVIEYRGCTADRMKWIHKRTGRNMEMGVIKHRVETEAEGFVVTEFLAEGQDENKYQAPLRKGERGVLLVEQMKRENGTLSATGTVLPLELPAIKPAPGAKA